MAGGGASAPLSGPYEDPLHLGVPFGKMSYYLKPWRSYMDTWPASRFLSTPGIVFKGDPADFDAVAQVLAESGVRSARVETYPGQFDYDDPTRLRSAEGSYLTAALTAISRHRVRPLLLLNANSGWPVPIREFTVNVASPALAGARTITISPATEIRPGYTGFRGMAYQIGYPLITSVNQSTGECQLSAPLQRSVPAGALTLYTLKYQPFAGAVFADGTPNPAAAETVNGWMTFVGAITRFALSVLGTVGAPDAGFDMEVWNEYTFGSHFLSDENYYDPPRSYREPIRYSAHGLHAEGPESILPMTVDYASDPANGLPGVAVISGFSNQRPWESGETIWPGQTGFSRHTYTGGVPRQVPPAHPVVNALGQDDGSNPFVPELLVSMPEWWLHGYQTEHVTRDIAPIFSPTGSPIGSTGHSRYAHRAGRSPADVWMTEVNFVRKPWGEQLAAELGIGYSDPSLQALLHRVAAKALLRLLVFHSHKGVQTANIYAVRDPSEGFEVLPDAFYQALAANNHQLSDAVRAQIGPQLETLSRAVGLFRPAVPIGTARPVTVAGLVEYDPRLVFAGDGTPAHPDRWHRDDFAVLPFQLNEQEFAIGYYVVTQNIVHEWNVAAGKLDSPRYDMPEQLFDISVGNVRGDGAVVSIYDPLKDRTVPAEVVDHTPGSITVRVPAVDYPRFLRIREAAPGPLIASPALARLADGRVRLTFSTNVVAPAHITWGPLPARAGSGAAESLAALYHQVDIAVAAGEGIRITCEHDGLRAVWPHWDIDVQGVPADSDGNLLPPFADPGWAKPAGAAVSPDGKALTLDNTAQPGAPLMARSTDMTLLPGHTYRFQADLAWSGTANPGVRIRRLNGEVYSSERQRIPHIDVSFTVPAGNESPHWIELWLMDSGTGTVTFANASLVDIPAPDTTPPVGNAQALPATQSSATFDVPWTASDGSGSGVASVKLYYTTDNGVTWAQFGAAFTASPISFTATADGQYGFAVRALDRAGNEEALPGGPGSIEASTTVTTARPPANLLPPLTDPGWDLPVVISQSGRTITLKARNAGWVSFVSPPLELVPGNAYQLALDIEVASGARLELRISDITGTWSGIMQVSMSGRDAFCFTVPATVPDRTHRIEFAAHAGTVSLSGISLHDA